MKWNIGDIEIKNRIVLAPMAGISNPTFIKIADEMGVGLAFTELISSEAIIRNNAKTLEMLKGIDKITIPVGVQLFGSNPNSLAASAKIITKLYPNVFIDINMGCPVPKIAIKSGGGSALLKNPELIREIVTKVVHAVDVPVTVKIRSGWDDEHINAVEVAKIIEESGAKALSIHARTRAQGYSGQADWNVIKEVVKNVSIPVIGNGDVKTCYDAKKMLDDTKCSAVMIARALMGNPWLIKECIDYLDNNTLPKKIGFNEKIDMMEYHLKKLIENTNESQAVLEIRGHLLNYLKGLPENKEIKNNICKCKNSKEIIKILEEYRHFLKEKELV